MCGFFPERKVMKIDEYTHLRLKFFVTYLIRIEFRVPNSSFLDIEALLVDSESKPDLQSYEASFFFCYCVKPLKPSW